jgi:hypothetical protein
MPFVLTDTGGFIARGTEEEVDLSQGAATKGRTFDSRAGAKDRRWFTTYPSAVIAQFLSPMHGYGRSPRVWNVNATVAKTGDTMRQVTAQITRSAEDATAAMTDAQRVAIALAFAPFLDGHAGYAAWAENAEKADLASMTPEQLDWLAAEAACWAHRAEWEAGQKGLTFNLETIIAGART